MDLTDLLTLLPAEWLFYALLVLKGTAMLNGFASWIAPAIKKMLGTPSESDGAAKQFAFGVAWALDLFAANTQKLADKEKIAKLENQLAEKDRVLAARLSMLEDSEKTIQRQAETLRKTFNIKAGK